MMFDQARKREVKVHLGEVDGAGPRVPAPAFAKTLCRFGLKQVSRISLPPGL
jgi:hypothetical protein